MASMSTLGYWSPLWNWTSLLDLLPVGPGPTGKTFGDSWTSDVAQPAVSDHLKELRILTSTHYTCSFFWYSWWSPQRSLDRISSATIHTFVKCKTNLNGTWYNIGCAVFDWLMQLSDDVEDVGCDDKENVLPPLTDSIQPATSTTTPAVAKQNSLVWTTSLVCLI